MLLIVRVFLVLKLFIVDMNLFFFIWMGVIGVFILFVSEFLWLVRCI